MLKVVDRLAGMDTAALAGIGSIGTERADLMLPGCAIFGAICSLWPAPMLRVADRGLREGMLRQLSQELS
jgi:exopolyphosphatase/guanosine-5'-triphosphate,3'-diphosphate pyrophosphatase